MSELKHKLMLNKERSWVPCYLKSEADKVIAEKDAEIEKLKAIRKVHIEAITSMGAGLHQDSEEIRKLKRALYKACANWAKCEEQINNRDAYDALEYLPSSEDKFRKREKRWCEMATKCLKKAEEYR